MNTINDSKIFLFQYLKVDPKLWENEKYSFGHGLYIAKVSSYIDYSNIDKLDRAKYSLICYIYPTYGLPGIGINHCGIIVNSSEDNIYKHSENTLVWSAILALKIVKPIYIAIAGSFKLGNSQNDYIQNPQSINLRSNLGFTEIIKPPEMVKNNTSDGLSNKLDYSKDDIILAKNLFSKILYVFSNNTKMVRVNYNLKLSLQFNILEKLHYENSIFSKLFTILDSLACNPHYKHSETVAKRISNFLSDVTVKNSIIGKEKIKKRIQEIWELNRNPELHGQPKFPEEVNDYNYSKDLYDLYEIIRLSMYKLLLLSDKAIEEYSSIPLQPNNKSLQLSKDDNNQRKEKAEKFFNKTHNIEFKLEAYYDFTNTQHALDSYK